jgi:hypothetical protein
MPTRPCSITKAPTAGTAGCTCAYDMLYTRNNRAGSMEADFWPKKQVFSVQNTHPRAHKAAPLAWAPRAARAGGRGTGGCLRLCVPVPTHQRTAVGVYMTEKYRGRPDPHPHRACAPHAAVLRTRAPTGLARPEMAVQTRTGAARDRRATERRTHYPTRRWHARSRCKEPLKHGTAPFDAHPYLCDVTAAPRRRSPAPPPPPAASSARPASNALPWRGGRFW